MLHLGGRPLEVPSLGADQTRLEFKWRFFPGKPLTFCQEDNVAFFGKDFGGIDEKMRAMREKMRGNSTRSQAMRLLLAFSIISSYRAKHGTYFPFNSNETV